MNPSKPFFNSKPGGRKQLYAGSLTKEQYRRLHWTKQLELRPLSTPSTYVKDERPVDYDNRLDNWDDPEKEEQ